MLKSCIPSRVASQKKQPDRQSRAGDSNIDPCAAVGTRPPHIDTFRSFDSFRCDLESPDQENCDRKTDKDQNNDQPNCPVWNTENSKKLRNSLRQSPAGDD